VTDEQRAYLAAIVAIAQQAARGADDLVNGALYRHVDPELRGHVSIALQHLQMAQQMLEQVQP
jgi:hypothetical protein